MKHIVGNTVVSKRSAMDLSGLVLGISLALLLTTSLANAATNVVGRVLLEGSEIGLDGATVLVWEKSDESDYRLHSIARTDELGAFRLKLKTESSRLRFELVKDSCEWQGATAEVRVERRLEIRIDARRDIVAGCRIRRSAKWLKKLKESE